MSLKFPPASSKSVTSPSSLKSSSSNAIQLSGILLIALKRKQIIRGEQGVIGFASLWQLCCFFKSILLKDFVVACPPIDISIYIDFLVKVCWDHFIYILPVCPGQRTITKAACSPFRPPRPACWFNSHVSLGSPEYNCHCSPKNILTNAHSQINIRDITAHASTFGADQQATGPELSTSGSRIWAKYSKYKNILPTPQSRHYTLLLSMSVITKQTHKSSPSKYCNFAREILMILSIINIYCCNWL